MWTGGAGDRTIHLLISGRPALLYLLSLDGHHRKVGDTLIVGITVHIFRQSLLEHIHGVARVCTFKIKTDLAVFILTWDKDCPQVPLSEVVIGRERVSEAV